MASRTAMQGAPEAMRITTHYSAAELSKLIEAANRVCDRGDKPELVVLRRLNVG